MSPLRHRGALIKFSFSGRHFVSFPHYRLLLIDIFEFQSFRCFPSAIDIDIIWSRIEIAKFVTWRRRRRRPWGCRENFEIPPRKGTPAKSMAVVSLNLPNKSFALPPFRVRFGNFWSSYSPFFGPLWKSFRVIKFLWRPCIQNGRKKGEKETIFPEQTLMRFDSNQHF